ncbi:AbrB/MazE/SpoVT family DNA-binding domain-containing protein [Candidatus Woesearchaeota archaeon]|nr:AbrB/MazE/SpoVT family DNA-binding domain-containing protein [Candidatus Woesearchaeota archaeon]
MIAVKTKQWGNSIGIVIPKAVAEEKGIGPDEEVLVEVEKKSKKTVLEELSGALPFKKPTEQLLRESRKALESKYW